MSIDNVSIVVSPVESKLHIRSSTRSAKSAILPHRSANQVQLDSQNILFYFHPTTATHRVPSPLRTYEWTIYTPRLHPGGLSYRPSTIKRRLSDLPVQQKSRCSEYKKFFHKNDPDYLVLSILFLWFIQQRACDSHKSFLWWNSKQPRHLDHIWNRKESCQAIFIDSTLSSIRQWTKIYQIFLSTPQ